VVIVAVVVVVVVVFDIVCMLLLVHARCSYDISFVLGHMVKAGAAAAAGQILYGL
jgi:hypothetical protein